MFPPDLIVILQRTIIAGFVCWVAQVAIKAILAFN